MVEKKKVKNKIDSIKKIHKIAWLFGRKSLILCPNSVSQSFSHPSHE